MNKYDSEIVAGILSGNGYVPAKHLEDANVILINTCSVRQTAETRVHGRLNAIKPVKTKKAGVILGVLGCMAERLGEELLTEHQFVDFILGPDHYRRLPQVLATVRNGGTEDLTGTECRPEIETYSDVTPRRIPGVSAWIAIMRGCNNYCAYCVVPYVRGRERSRSLDDIIAETESFTDEGFVEVTLLGQNVNSYSDGQHDFADLLERLAQVHGILRVRFATSHPKDVTQKLIDTIAKYDTICNHVHLPVQSGSDKILGLMNRRYDRNHYFRLVKKLRAVIPDVAITTDIIVGFPGEGEEDFVLTRDLVQEIGFDAAFLFKYSPREGTAATCLSETVSETEKVARLEELLSLQKGITLAKNQALVGRQEVVLIEGPSKKSVQDYMGRTETNKIVVLPKEELSPGDLVPVEIVGAAGHTLFGKLAQPAGSLMLS